MLIIPFTTITTHTHIKFHIFFPFTSWMRPVKSRCCADWLIQFKHTRCGPPRSALVGRTAGPVRRSFAKMTCVHVFISLCLFVLSLRYTMGAEVSLWNIRINPESVSVTIRYMREEKRVTASYLDKFYHTSIWQPAKQVLWVNTANK